MRNIAVSIVGRTYGEIIEHVTRIMGRVVEIETEYKDSDLKVGILEFRADYYEKVTEKTELIELLGEVRRIIGDRQLLFTYRSEEEGGEFRHDRAGFMLPDIYDWVINSKLVDMVDIELMSGNYRVARYAAKAHDAGLKTVISYHNFEMTPRDEKILDMMESMETLGGDVLKIAVTPNKEFDVRRVLELLDKLKAGGYKDYRITKPVVIISMGDMGKKSRFCLGEKGSLFTFAYVGEESAPGQVELGEIFKKLA
ncbi:MAG: type I 3-dehydroquinate dehydratase [Eubacterium sp.]|nr:type I 3-dehydroquinate dehydratase [Eubacterium sp.]